MPGRVARLLKLAEGHTHHPQCTAADTHTVITGAPCPSTHRSVPAETAQEPVPPGHRRPTIAEQSAFLRSWLSSLLIALSTMVGLAFPLVSMVWPGSQRLFPDVAVNADVNSGNTDIFDLLDHRVSAGHHRGPPATVDEPRSTQHTYYVVAGTTSVLVHNCGGARFAVDTDGVATEIRPLGRGSTGRTVPESLDEKLAMDEAMSNPAAGRQLRLKMTDDRWDAGDGWVKMAQNVNGTEIHYVRNTITGQVDDFKFK